MRMIALCIFLMCSLMTDVWSQEMRCLKYFTPGDNNQKGARSVAISPRGEYVVVADEGNRLKVWNSNNGAIIATIGETAYISSVSFTPDGRRLVLGAIDGSLTLWDSASWKKVGIWELQSSSVFSIQFSPDGNQSATGGMDGSVALRNASNGRIVANLPPHDQAISGLAFDKKHDQLFSSSLDEIRVSNSTSGKKTSSLHHSDSKSGATALATSTNGGFLAGGHPEKSTISVWDLETNTLIQELVGHSREITALQFSLDGNQLTSASMDGSVRTWDVATGNPLYTRHAHAGSAISMSAAISIDRIVTGGTDGEAIIHEGRNTLGMLRSHLGQLNGVNYEIDGKNISAHVQTPTGSPVWRLWPVKDTAIVDEAIQDSRLSLVWHAAIAPNGTTRARTIQGDAAIGLRANDLSWQSDTWREANGESIVGVWISETGQSVVAAGQKFLFLWDANDTSSQLTIPSQTYQIENLAVSPSGKVAVVGGVNGLLEAFELTSNTSLWNKQASVILEKGKQVRPSHINGLRFVREHVVALIVDDCLQIWDTRSGTMLYAKPQTKNIDLRVLASSTDGLFATGGFEMRPSTAKRISKQWVVKLWKLNSDEKSIQLLGEAITGDFEIRHVCIAPDNSSIATTDSAGWMRIWECNNMAKPIKP